MTMNYIDPNGNYRNVENLTLKQIYERGFRDGLKYKEFREQERREWLEEVKKEAHDLE